MGMSSLYNYNMAGIKRTAADKWFSLYVRARDKWTCQRCHRKFPQYIEGGNNRALQGLDNAHLWGRGKNMTRFEPDNCLALCYGCHSVIDADIQEKKELWLKYISQERMDELQRLSKQPFKGIKKEQNTISTHYRQLFRQLNEK
jgi:hypothetical protein